MGFRPTDGANCRNHAPEADHPPIASPRPGSIIRRRRGLSACCERRIRVMISLTRRRLITGAAALALPGFVRPAAAEAVDTAAAKREGKVTLYTSAPIAAAQKVANAFQQKYGITVELFRSGGTQVLRRFMMEQQAGHAGADVLVSSDPA